MDQSHHHRHQQTTRHEFTSSIPFHNSIIHQNQEQDKDEKCDEGHATHRLPQLPLPSRPGQWDPDRPADVGLDTGDPKKSIPRETATVHFASSSSMFMWVIGLMD